MKCMNCGKELRRRNMVFCSKECRVTYREKYNNKDVLIICTKIPGIYPELRPRLGEAMVATKKVGYDSTNYVVERGGKHVLLRNDEVMEVAG